MPAVLEHNSCPPRIPTERGGRVQSNRRRYTHTIMAMRAESIRAHLRVYSIYQKRKTTINHAFASALAPSWTYSPIAMSQALSVLGQSADADLSCVYCDALAETWDHLTGLVKNSELSGFGHQLGNLVPCCRHCNSRKGGKDWALFLSEEIPEPRRSKLSKRLAEYQERFANHIDLSAAQARHPDDWTRYDSLRADIYRLMQEADRIAEKLRSSFSSPGA